MGTEKTGERKGFEKKTNREEGRETGGKKRRGRGKTTSGGALGWTTMAEGGQGEGSETAPWPRTGRMKDGKGQSGKTTRG